MARRLEQLEGAEDVGANEALGIVDRTVDVRFGGEVHDAARPLGAEDLAHRRAVRDVGLHERETRVLLDVLQALAVARVGESVEDHDPVLGVDERVTNEVASDEAGAARHDQRSHGRSG